MVPYPMGTDANVRAGLDSTGRERTDMTVSDRPQGRRRRPDTAWQEEFDHHLDTLRDLGPGYTDTVAESLVERVDRLIDQRIEDRLPRKAGRRQWPIERRNVGTISAILLLGIPLSILANDEAGLSGLMAVAFGVVVVLGLDEWKSQLGRWGVFIVWLTIVLAMAVISGL